MIWIQIMPMSFNLDLTKQFNTNTIIIARFTVQIDHCSSWKIQFPNLLDNLILEAVIMYEN